MMGSLFGSALGFVTGNWQRLAIYGLLAVILLGSAAGWGYMRGVKRLYEYQADQATATIAVVVKQGEITERIVTRYVKVQAATQVVEQNIKKEVARYAEKNPASCLDARWGRLHDGAALGTPSRCAQSR